MSDQLIGFLFNSALGIAVLVIFCRMIFNLYKCYNPAKSHCASELMPRTRRVLAYQLKVDEMKRLIKQVASEGDAINFQLALDEFRQIYNAADYDRNVMRAFSEACAGKEITP